MGARLRVFLNSEENRTLFELRTATTVPQRVKDRAAVIRLRHQGMFVEKIAAFFDWHVRPVRETLHRWQRQGLGGLWDAPRPGPQPRWQEADIEDLEACLREEPRTDNSEQLADQLEAERNVHLSGDHLRRLLPKRGGDLETDSRQPSRQTRAGRESDETSGPRDVAVGRCRWGH